TMTLGNLAAIGQSNIKRFLAYSSIAHAGYALIGLAAFSRTGATSVLIYMTFYVAMNLGAFYCVIWVRERLGTELISEYQGLGYRTPLIAISLSICLLSLTGLPPFAGFIGKYYLFAAALDRAGASGGGIYYVLALVGVLNSAVSLYYYV